METPELHDGCFAMVVEKGNIETNEVFCCCSRNCKSVRNSMKSVTEDVKERLFGKTEKDKN